MRKDSKINKKRRNFETLFSKVELRRMWKRLLDSNLPKS